MGRKKTGSQDTAQEQRVELTLAGRGIWLLMITPSIRDVCLHQKVLNYVLTYVHSTYCIQETFTTYYTPALVLRIKR